MKSCIFKILAALVLMLMPFGALAFALDCNGNNQDDLEDVALAEISFSAEESYELPFGQGTNLIEEPKFADIDGDGTQEVVVVLRASLSETPVLLILKLGNDAKLEKLAEYPAGEAPSTFVLGDFSGDGAVDIVIANGRKLELFLNDGSGDLSAHSMPSFVADVMALKTIQQKGRSLGILAATQNAEGNFPYLTLHTIWASPEQGVYAVAEIFSVRGFYRRMQALPLTKDGTDDILLQWSGRSQPARCSLDPSFCYPPEMIFPGGARRFLSRNDGGYTEESVSFLSDGSSFVIGDLNEDGLSDSIYTGAWIREKDLEGETLVPDGTLRIPQMGRYRISFDSPAARPAVVADFDGDGLDDLLTHFQQVFPKPHGLRVFRKADDLYFEKSIELEMEAANWSKVVSGDFTGDGLADLVYYYQSKNSIYYRRNETIPSESSDINRNVVPDECERAVPGDFDGDGRTDYTIVRKMLGGLYWFTRSADSTSMFADPTLFGLSAYDTPRAADWDGDGIIDPGVVRDWGGLLYWYARRPDGSAIVTQWGLRGDSSLSGHFDKDKVADKVVVRNYGGLLYWFFNLSGGETVQLEQWGLYGDKIFAADIDGDGIDELIVAREVAGGIWWFARTMAGEALPVVAWGLAGDDLLAPRDFSGDGKADWIVARNVGPAKVAYVHQASTEYARTIGFGLSGDTPLWGYFSRGRIPEFGVYRTLPGVVSQHYVKRRDARVTFAEFGLAGDMLICPDGRIVER